MLVYPVALPPLSNLANGVVTTGQPGTDPDGSFGEQGGGMIWDGKQV